MSLARECRSGSIGPFQSIRTDRDGSCLAGAGTGGDSSASGTGTLGRQPRKLLFDFGHLGVRLGGCGQCLGDCGLGRVRLREGLHILAASGKDAEGERTTKPGEKSCPGHLVSVVRHALRNYPTGRKPLEVPMSGSDRSCGNSRSGRHSASSPAALHHLGSSGMTEGPGRHWCLRLRKGAPAAAALRFCRQRGSGSHLRACPILAQKGMRAMPPQGQVDRPGSSGLQAPGADRVQFPEPAGIGRCRGGSPNSR